MSHKHIAQEFLQMIIAGDIRKAFEQHVSQDFTHHNQYIKPGREELILGMEGNHDNFPDKIFDIELILEENDKVVTYSLLKFTPDHKGIRVVHILRFVGEQIVEMRDVAMKIE